MTDNPLALLRAQVAGLLSQLDTAVLPRPDRVRSGRSEKHPGLEWTPAPGWTVFTVEDGAAGPGVLYLDHACDTHYRFGEPGDWEALTTARARAIGMALLAAADRADEITSHRTGGTVLPMRPTRSPRDQEHTP